MRKPCKAWREDEHGWLLDGPGVPQMRVFARGPWWHWHPVGDPNDVSVIGADLVPAMLAAEDAALDMLNAAIAVLRTP